MLKADKFSKYCSFIYLSRGCTRLALNSTPIPQDFKLLRRCAEVKSKFAFFQEQRERFAIDSVVFSQDAFCLIPKILNAVDVVLMVYKRFGMVDAGWIKPLTLGLS